MTAREVLHAIHAVRRIGNDRTLSDWEHREPDLIEHFLEALSDLHLRILNLKTPPTIERRLIGYQGPVVDRSRLSLSNSPE